VVGVVDCGTYGRRFLVEDVDVAALTSLPTFSRGNPRSGLLDRTMTTLFGAAFPIGGIILEVVTGQRDQWIEEVWGGDA
jgi:hypothetical protein